MVFSAKGQDNLQVQFAYRGSVAAAKFLPSSQIMKDQKFETSFQYTVWVANRSLSYGSLRTIYKNQRLTRFDVNKIIAQLDDENRLGLGQDFMVFGLGLNIPIKKHPVVWSFTISDRFNVNSFVPKQLLQVIWLGNKVFEGRTLDLSNTRIVGMYFREFSLGFATQIAQWNNWKLRGGMRFNYYQGLSGLDNLRQGFLTTTAVNAESINLDYDFEYRFTGIEDFDLFDPRGHGFGLNLGLTFSYNDKLNFDLGVTDIGSITYEKNVRKIGTQNDFTFTGLGLQELLDPTAFLDSLERVFTPEIDTTGENSFKMPIGTRFSFLTSWQFGETSKTHGPKTLYLSYTQGFSNDPGVTTKPKFTTAIHRPMFRHFDIGVSMSFGGFNNFAVGGLLGMHFKHFRFSFQTDDFTGLIAPDNATGGGGGFIFQVLF